MMRLRALRQPVRKNETSGVILTLGNPLGITSCVIVMRGSRLGIKLVLWYDIISYGPSVTRVVKHHALY